MKNIVIIGAGDLGKEVVWLIEDINKKEPTYLILGFLDDDPGKTGKEFYGYKILGGTEKLSELSSKMPLRAVVAIQDSKVRESIVESHPEFSGWESIVHPSAVMASSSEIGRGSMVFPGVTVSVDTKIGEFALLYIHSVVCNDSRIGDYVTLMAGCIVSEHTELGDGCFISSGECTAPHSSVGRGETLKKGRLSGHRKGFPEL